MDLAKLGFGCCVDNYGEKIYVAGGSVGMQKATDSCQVYNIASDQWSALPTLSEPKFS